MNEWRQNNPDQAGRPATLEEASQIGRDLWWADVAKVVYECTRYNLPEV